MTELQKKYWNRVDNFYWNREAVKTIIEADNDYCTRLCFHEGYMLSIASSHRIQSLKEEGKNLQLVKELVSDLQGVFHEEIQRAYPLLFCIFSKEFQKKLLETCLFVFLSAFLHTSTRLKRKTYLDFIYEYDPLNFSDPTSSNHCDKMELVSIADALRKSRYRRLKQGKVYIPHIQWTAVSQDLEHELSFRYVIENSDHGLADTYKRFGNLYNDILKVVDGNRDDEYLKKLLRAREKFLSKLKKIDYLEYFHLLQKLIDHINADKQYYGINLYRLEKRMMPYRMIRDLNWLVSHRGYEKEKKEYLLRTVALVNIPFPKIYETLLSLQCYRDNVQIYADIITDALRDARIMGCLIWDSIIEENLLNDNWEDAFCCILNELTPNVLYDLASLNLDSPPEYAQEEFESLIQAPVNCLLHNAIEDFEPSATNI